MNFTQYGERKEPHSVIVTPTAWAALEQVGKELNLSRSEMIKRYAKSLIKSKVE